MIEGTRTRTQVFEGVVIKRQGSGVRETFTVRKQSFGVGVERTFPLHSPKIEKLEVAAHGDVRRAKLYYLRDRVGKAARVAERRWGIADEVLDTDDDGAVDAEGVTQDEAPQAVPAPAPGEDDGRRGRARGDRARGGEGEEPASDEGEAAGESEAAPEDAESAEERPPSRLRSRRETQGSPRRAPTRTRRPSGTPEAPRAR